MPFGGPTHERMAPVDDEPPQTTSAGDVWAQRQHGTCNSSANATGFERALTYSPPFFVRAHQTTKEDYTPGTLKARQVALVEPVAYLKDLVMPRWSSCCREDLPACCIPVAYAPRPWHVTLPRMPISPLCCRRPFAYPRARVPPAAWPGGEVPPRPAAGRAPRVVGPPAEGVGP